jgi:acetoin utilization deacetylase AcuC-like enzyme
MAATVRDLGAELEAPVLVCLEGGYDPAALGRSVVETAEALGSDREPEPVPVEAAGRYAERAASVRGPGAP